MRNLLLYLSAIVVAAAALWFAFYGTSTTTSEPASALVSGQQEPPDAFVEQAVVTQYDLQGDKNYTLHTERADHFPNSELTELDQPRMTTFDNDIPYQTVRAETGLILPDGSTLQLDKDVVMTQKRNNNTVTLETDFITIYSAKNIADTDHPVVITQHNGVTRATGMTAYYKEDRVQLKSKVRGVYETNQ